MPSSAIGATQVAKLAPVFGVDALKASNGIAFTFGLPCATIKRDQPLAMTGHARVGVDDGEKRALGGREISDALGDVGEPELRGDRSGHERNRSLE
jgi:hypothetical protein